MSAAQYLADKGIRYRRIALVQAGICKPGDHNTTDPDLILSVDECQATEMAMANVRAVMAALDLERRRATRDHWSYSMRRHAALARMLHAEQTLQEQAWSVWIERICATARRARAAVAA